MSIFKKTIKYSKPSKDLDDKLKHLDEGLKKTKMVSSEEVEEIIEDSASLKDESIQIYDEIEEKVVEELYDWRQSFITEDVDDDATEEDLEIHNNLVRVESYISENNKELIEIRDNVFKEISESTLLNLPEIKEKITKVLEFYEQIQEGLLNLPPEEKTEDPLTPLDKNFVTQDELSRHYNLFINRIQEQIATIGGGGETKLQYLDDIVGIATNAAAYDGKFLRYNHSIEKFEFVTNNSGSGGVVGAAGTWAVDSIGINTTKNVGIGTTARSDFKLYVDGGNVPFGTGGGTSSFNASEILTNFRVGDFVSGWQEPHFDINEFAYWGSTKLTSSEASKIYNLGTTTDLQNTPGVTPPTRYWTYEDANNLTKDTISDSNKGAISGGTQRT